MEHLTVQSFGKINLSLDVREKLPSGYHRVEMVMQLITLHDDVSIKWIPNDKGEIAVSCATNRHYLPVDDRNLATKAARLMAEKFGAGLSGTIRIDIKKRLPVAAGLAGGSSNGAAVLHGVNQLWHLGLNVADLCLVGKELGADVPFCIMGQAACDKGLKRIFKNDPLASGCALATGIGTDLLPLPGFPAIIVLSKPPVHVSTREVYQGLSLDQIKNRPDNRELIAGLREKDLAAVEKNMVNVLEFYTLKMYDTVVYTKNKMKEICPQSTVLMSGSGPTVYGVYHNIEDARKVFAEMIKINKETFLTETAF